MAGRVKELLYPGSPWRTEYPELLNITTDVPCAPAYCEVTGNRYTRVKGPFVAGGTSSLWGSWHVTVANNTEEARAK